MKLPLLFAILFISAFNTVNAAEAEIDLNPSAADYASYCEEQAQLAGIEEAAEKSEYIRECVQSYAIPAEDTFPQDNG